MKRISELAPVPALALLAVFTLAGFLAPASSAAQTGDARTGVEARTGMDGSPDDGPRLVVGIVVDQMRYEYLHRYRELYGEGGFRRLMDEGYNFANTHFNYFPTYTGPGHASISTGTTPSVHGIVGNDWFDRELGRAMYVVEDPSVRTVGAEGSVGQMSPRNLESTTLTDELKSFNPASKVVALSMKDRGAVLPAGHAGDAAYWYDPDSGHFVSSTWYMDRLPGWVEAFNREGLARRFSDSTWTLALDPEAYPASNVDDTPYEGTFDGESAPVFPHAMDGSFSRIRTSPFGNTLVNELAKRAVAEEGLGEDADTDFLGVSYSSTDYVGHQFGPRSLELADTYLRLDRDLADLFSFLDERVGEGRYTVFLTSDHGVVDVPEELTDRGLPGGKFDSDSAVTALRDMLSAEYGEGDWVRAYMNQQVYLDRTLVRRRGGNLGEMQRRAAQFLLDFEGVLSTNTAERFRAEEYREGHQAFYDRGFRYQRSGDVFIQLKPGWLDSDYPTGTSHSSPWTYDTHVPLLFMGWGVPPGATYRKTVIPQIAPTVSAILDIPFPSGTDARVLEFE